MINFTINFKLSNFKFYYMCQMSGVGCPMFMFMIVKKPSNF